MNSISLCMIVRNEEESLGRCLSSVRDAVDEIIIADTGSTDSTIAIAQSFGATVVHFKWIDDFAAARNFCFQQATQTFILWLDADDVLEPADLAKLKKLKEQPELPYDSISMPYHLTIDQHGKPLYSLRRNRLVRRDAGFLWKGPVHEYLEVSGRIHHSDIAVTHRKERQYTDRNLRIYLKRSEAGEQFSPRDQYYFANELRDHSRHEEAAEWYEKFLRSGLGWIEDNIGACMKQSDCYASLGDKQRQLASLLRTLYYDLPRAEFCCKIGAYFLEQKQYGQAIYWYTQATLLEKPKHNMGMTDTASSTWLPHLQLTLCYDRIGNRGKALHHHRQAKRINPTHASIAYNDKYFSAQKR